MKTSESLSNIAGFSKYRVTGAGEVISMLREQHRTLKPGVAGKGYLMVHLLADDGSRGHLYVHRLVASAFLPNPEGKREVNHIDGSKTNNVVTNLEWATPSENKIHAAALGLNGMIGETNPSARYSEAEVARIRTLRRNGLTYKAIANEVGCSVNQANRIARGLLRTRKAVFNAAV